MGEVYQALHEPTGRTVAIKLLTGKDQAQRERLQQSVRLEAEALARLSHPGVVAVLDRGVVGPDADQDLIPGAPWLAIEFCQGGHLELDQIDSWRGLRAIIVDLLRVLAHIHARGILHGDLKPANILFEEEAVGRHRRPKVADFGLARLLAAGGADYSSIAGTPLKWVLFVGILGLGWFAPKIIVSRSLGAAHAAFWVYAGMWGALMAPMLWAYAAMGEAMTIITYTTSSSPRLADDMSRKTCGFSATLGPSANE